MKERQKLKVSSTTKPQALAGAVAKALTEDKQDVELVGIGAGATQQLVKGLIMARRFTSSSGLDLAFVPAFQTVEIDSKEITAIVWYIKIL